MSDFLFFNETATTEIYTLSLHDALPISKAMFDPFEYLVLRHRDGLLKTQFRNALGRVAYHVPCHLRVQNIGQKTRERSEEHTSELQSRQYLVCRLLLEKKNYK